MKLSSPQMKFAAYVAVLAVISSLSLAAIFHSQKNSLARRTVMNMTAARASYARLPLSFQENMGQTDSRVRFVSRGPGYELFLTPEEAVLALRHSAQHRPTSFRERARRMRRRRAPSEPAPTASLVRVRFAGANSNPEVTGADELLSRMDYFTGNNPKNWHTNVPSYSRVQYRSIYPGVDLVFYGNQRQLEYDFVVAPQADPKSIALEVAGASRLHIDADGNLLIGVQDGEVELHRPVVYQQVSGVRREVAATYGLADANRITFALGDYDRSQSLIIDPVLNYSTYLGGANNDVANGIAVDSQGRACITGQTMSTDFPIPAGVNTFGSGASAKTATLGSVFLSVLKADGSALVYSAYLTGATGGQDLATGIAVDSSNNIYITGFTTSTDFPVTTSSSPSGLAGLNTTAPDSFGSAFLSKINPSSTGNASLVYSTFLAGSGNAALGFGDEGGAVAADAHGNAYVVGITSSADFPSMNPIPSPPNFAALPNPTGSAFVTRIDTTKSGPNSLIYSTLLGGDGANEAGNLNFNEGFAEFAFGVAVDGSNNAYVTGTTTSSGMSFPTTSGALQTSANPSNALGGAFFAKINTAVTAATAANALVYSTYLEGDVLDEGKAIALGPGGVAYIVGDTSSHAGANGFPLTNTTPTASLVNNGGMFPSAPNISSGVAFLTLIDPSQSTQKSLKYSVLLGGATAGTIAHGVSADTTGNAYLAGAVAATDFPITFGAFQLGSPNLSGTAFVAKIDPVGNGTSDLLYSSFFGGRGPSAGSIADQAFAIAIDTATPPSAFITGSTASPATNPNPFPVTSGAFQTTLAGNGTTTDAFVAKLTLEPTVSVSPTSLNFGSVLVGTTSAPQTVTITNNTLGMVTFAGTAFTFTGTNFADFAAVAPAAAVNGVNPCTASIAGGASCAENITFTPAAGPAPLPGAESATLNVNDSDPSSPQTVTLTGTGTTTPPNFTVTAPAAVSVTQGVSKTFTVTVTPQGGFNQTVTLSCSNLPMFTTCTPNPAMVALADGKTAQTSMVTIDTDVAAASIPRPAAPVVPMIPPMVAAIALSLCALAMLVSASARRYRIPLALGMLVTLFLAAGCSGHHHTVTPTGTTNITITGTAGNTVNSTQVALTVTAP